MLARTGAIIGQELPVLPIDESVICRIAANPRFPSFRGMVLSLGAKVNASDYAKEVRKGFGALKPMPKQSAGLLLYRQASGGLEVFLAHPGGPYWAKKDDGAWSIPKGEFGEGDDALASAQREFSEETGLTVTGKFQALTPIRQAGGKIVYAWAVKADLDASAIRSNSFSMEWPPGTGKMRDFPEVDRAAWFSIGEARRKLLKSQVILLDQLERILRSGIDQNC